MRTPSGKRRVGRPRLRVDILTLFPGMFEPFLSSSILGRAREKRLLEVGLTDLREFASDRRRTVDDRPYGGGSGMVLLAEPVYQALRKVRRRGSLVIHLSPQGRTFDQGLAQALSRERLLVLLCGHYEAIDERALDGVDMEVSLGDFVLTGGEAAAMAVIDAVTRLLPGALPKEDALTRESFGSDSGGLLDHPHYTRPRVWRGKKVPEVLLSGDHARIDAWRRAAALKATRIKRPDLLARKGRTRTSIGRSP
ncbi:MAG: tRNA (guanosine(37)-N1)-methyltransferase TrmD [Elusimicrobiota bacterium]